MQIEKLLEEQKAKAHIHWLNRKSASVLALQKNHCDRDGCDRWRARK